MSLCPCNSSKKYKYCCAPYIQNITWVPNPEALMRSRYTAYCLGNFEYIRSTMAGPALQQFDVSQAQRDINRLKWISLKIISAETPIDDNGYVEFIAQYILNQRLKSLHEISQFKKHDGQWFYINGTHKHSQLEDKLISKNQTCPCSSGKKYKNCHGHLSTLSQLDRHYE